MDRKIHWLFGFIPIIITTRRIQAEDELFGRMAVRFKAELELADLKLRAELKSDIEEAVAERLPDTDELYGIMEARFETKLTDAVSRRKTS